jgi:opacity protein-like surface antigen
LEKIICKMNTHKLVCCIPIIIFILLIMDFNSIGYAKDPDTPLYYCQVMGMNMTLEEEDADVDGDDYNLTIFGAAAQRPLKKNGLEYGYEFGLLFSMKNDSRLIEASSGPSGGVIKVQFENQMLLIDYFGGGYVGYSFSKRLRLYAAAGPLIVYGRRAFDSEEEDTIKSEIESKLSAGLYGRAGIEFKITDIFMIGTGVRAVKSGLKFDEPAGKIRYEGIQYVFNITFLI